MNPMLRAVHPRRARVQKGQELATVQMPPRPFLRVVVDAQPLFTPGAVEALLPRMVNPHINPPLADRQFHPAHRPRRRQASRVSHFGDGSAVGVTRRGDLRVRDLGVI
jgi:hypothetical protein